MKGPPSNFRVCPLSIKRTLRPLGPSVLGLRRERSFGSFFLLQYGGLRGLPYEVLQPQSQETDRPVEYGSRSGVPVPPSDAASKAEATVGLLFLRGEGRERQDGFSGEVPRKSRSTSFHRSTALVSPAGPKTASTLSKSAVLA